MILKRMTRDLCLQGQYTLLGTISVAPRNTGERTPVTPELYRSYSDCSRAVAGAPDCSERRAVHRTHPACAKLRALHE